MGWVLGFAFDGGGGREYEEVLVEGLPPALEFFSGELKRDIDLVEFLYFPLESSYAGFNHAHQPNFILN